MFTWQKLLSVVLAGCAVSCASVRVRPMESPAAARKVQVERGAPVPGAGAMTPIARRTGYAAADDGARIYYEVCGSGPAMVFVHGLGGNHAVWFQQVAHFARTHTVVTISQRGFAPSTGDQTRYQVTTLARDLEAVLDAAAVRRAVVIGQSMGGWTALEFALRSPGRVEALVLADTLGGISDAAIEAHMHEVTEAASRLRDSPPPLGVHPALGSDFSRRRPDLGYLYQTLTAFGAPAPGAIAKQLATARVPAERAKGLSVPTLFIVGSNDRLFPPSLVRRASEYVAGSRVAEIAGAGHSPYFEQPGVWNDTVDGFLAKR